MRRRQPYSLYFRHPYTHTGDTLEKRDAITRGLAARGYTVMPHTIENSDWLFNVAYVKADAAGRAKLRGEPTWPTRPRRRRSPRPRPPSCSAGTTCRRRCSSTRSRSTPMRWTRCLTMFEGRGYRFITLDEAMRDKAYATPDAYVGKTGPSLALPLVPDHRSGLQFPGGSRGSGLGHGSLRGGPAALGAIQSEDVHGSHAPPESLGCAHRPHPADRPDPALRRPPPDPRGDHAAGLRRAAAARLEGALPVADVRHGRPHHPDPRASPGRSRTTWPRR